MKFTKRAFVVKAQTTVCGPAKGELENYRRTVLLLVIVIINQ
ncbi:MAG: hypothetical protein ABJB11_14610 [Ferruginibacter sp.]